MRAGMALLLIGLLGPGAVAAAEHDPAQTLYFGSVAMDIPAEMHRRLKPLTDYLGSEIKRPVQLRLSANLNAAADEVAAGRVDIAYLTPVAYLRAHSQGDVRLVAKMKTRDERSFRLMVVVRHDSPIKNPRDLVGKSFAFGDPAAILQRAVVVGTGVKLEELGSYKFLGHYDNIARGVASRDFDAGILKDTTAYEWERKGLRVLHASPDLPPYNIVVSRRIDEALYAALRRAFLKLDPANPEHLRIIKSLDPNYSGFAPASDADYDVVRKLIRPFDK